MIALKSFPLLIETKSDLSHEEQVEQLRKEQDDHLDRIRTLTRKLSPMSSQIETVRLIKEISSFLERFHSEHK